MLISPHIYYPLTHRIFAAYFTGEAQNGAAEASTSSVIKCVAIWVTRTVRSGSSRHILVCENELAMHTSSQRCMCFHERRRGWAESCFIGRIYRLPGPWCNANPGRRSEQIAHCNTERPGVRVQLKALWLCPSPLGVAELGGRVFSFYETSHPGWCNICSFLFWCLCEVRAVVTHLWMCVCVCVAFSLSPTHCYRWMLSVKLIEQIILPPRWIV